MKRTLNLILVALAIISLFSQSIVLAQSSSGADPYLWLEEVEGERALAWVTEHVSLANLIEKRFNASCS